MSRYGVDKSDFVHFASSVLWHRKILMMTTRLNGDIDRAVWGVYWSGRARSFVFVGADLEYGRF